MKHSDICLYLGPADRAELQALLSNRNTPRKLVWRAEIVLDDMQVESRVWRTTIAKCVIGLERPDSGEILLDGAPTDPARLADRAHAGAVHRHRPRRAKARRGGRSPDTAKERPL